MAEDAPGDKVSFREVSRKPLFVGPRNQKICLQKWFFGGL